MIRPPPRSPLFPPPPLSRPPPDGGPRPRGPPPRLSFEPFGYEANRAANRITFGRDAIPYYAFEDARVVVSFGADFLETRSEEHTSELQSQSNLVCRLLLEKKKKKKYRHS